MAKNDNLTDFVTDIADTLRTALKQDSTHKINPQDFSGIITDIANGSTIETEDITITPSETVQEVTRTEGKYINKVTVNPIQTESLDVVPTQSSQAIQSPEGKYYKEVNVGAVTSAIDSNITPTNIRAGVSILGVQGNLEPDKPNQTKTVNPSTEMQVVTADTGYELESVTVNAVTSSIDSNIIPENIRKDTTILGVTGTLEEGGGKASPEYVSFYQYSGTSLDLSWLDTRNMTNMNNMFSYCHKLTNLDVSGLNTSNVTNMYYMFTTCDSLTNLDVSNFDTSKVIDMQGMFRNCKKLTSLDLSNFDTSKVTTMSYMFDSCYWLTSLDVSHFNTSNVTNMSYMFDSCSSLTSLDVSHFNTSNVTDMSYMFYNCSSLTSLDVSNFNTSNVTNMYSMFRGCYVLTILDLRNFNTSKVTNMSNMLNDCRAITSINISNFDTSNVTDMYGMFFFCSKLTSIIGTLDMQKVTNVGLMFSSCSSLEEVHIHNLGVDLSLSNSSKLTHDCLVELINNLQTVTSTKTLTLGSTNLAKLTDAEKQVATDKGWTLA